jgi:serine phosphatase RsbU (regulator of sigma subunit)
VGGDFFDVVKLSDHRAGVFIADVMGHGARSALVTAILRTLWQGFVQQADDPGQFLALINQHFHDIIERASEFVFASAFYLILDTERRQASYASAGHPAPLVADRQTGRVSPLLGPADNRPALGLMRHSRYLTLTRPIRAGQTLLLFTDGITEAPAASGEEFGRERLCRAIEAHLDCPVAPLMEAIVQSVNRHTGAVPLPDDICLVGVEVTPSLSAIPAERAVVQNVV